MWSRIPNWATFNLSFRAAALLLVLAALGGLLPASAQAHAVLRSSSPANNEILDRSPSRVDLHFNEVVRLVSASATDASGDRIDLQGDTSGSVVLLNLPGSISRGTTIVSYRVASEDGHPIGGSVVFHVGTPTATSTEVAQGSVSPLAIAIWVVHASSIIFLAVVVGGALFDRWLGIGNPSPSRHDLAAFLGVLLFSTNIYLQGLDEIGGDLSLAGLQPFLAASHSSPAIASSLALLAVVLVSLPLTGRRSSLAAAALAMIAASSSFIFSGHCSVVEPRWLARACVFLHGGVMIFWIGSLIPLWRASATQACAGQLLGFSRAIPLPFVGMLLAGGALAWIELPALDTVLLSMYGRVLLLKILLVSLLCLLALYNRVRLTRPALAGSQNARWRLRRSIKAEMLLAIAIVAAASLWRFAGPDQLQFAAAAPLSVHMHSDAAMAQLELQAQPDGTSTVRVSLLTPDLDPLEPSMVLLRVKKPEAGVEPIKYSLVRSPDDVWEASGLPIGDPKGWEADVQILIDDFTTVHLEGDLAPSDDAAEASASPRSADADY
ncbi:putative copper export protein [Rhizobium leguminosarum bv. trifolii WSM597]|uniref:Putative copper export protein n=1 Tax=Rhizobium leguminosarum bv. trifolii WSM597 TaxID=754764 RepID=J0H703_RHILT|nr:copper resistance protein CopC [Rhizobium leguminosarum]EJB05980.1 putative copper export protein [Rhizobium leguminosarum bv. trifolii WSM597]